MASKPGSRRRLRVVSDSSGNHSSSSRSKLADLDSDQLVGMAVAGDREPFDELVRRTYRDAFGLAVRLTGNEEDARDVVQDAYLRAYRAMGKFRSESRFSTWLYRIVANCSATHMAKISRHRHGELPDEAQLADSLSADDPESAAAASDLAQRLESAISDLPVRLRSVVVLRDLYGMSHDAIATELDISVSAAKVRLHRARLRLRERVFPLPGEDSRAV